MKKLRVFEAFAGYGSQRLALDRLKTNFPGFDYEVVGISEIDPYALDAYRQMHGDCPNFGDISQMEWECVPDFDLFTYSFPCQDISVAGLQKGFAEGSNTRSSLLWECRRAIQVKKPHYMLMENVKALTQKKFRPHFQQWIDWLDSQGYVNFWKVLNAKSYGVPQNRDRVFLVSILSTEDVLYPRFEFPEPIPLTRCIADIMEEDVDESYYLRQEQVDRIIAHCDRKVSEGCGFKTNFTPPHGISGAIKTKEGSREYDTYITL